jgi:hypothetical protein
MGVPARLLHISVSHRDSVALLDAHVGAKA